MGIRHRPASRVLLALGGAAALSGCELDYDHGCFSYLSPSVIVEVRDRATGMPAARGATGLSEHESGVLTEFHADRDLRLWGSWPDELPGTHTVLVRKPGFLTETARADVDSDRCHVVPETVQFDLARDPRAVPESPLSFIEGPDTAGWRDASAEVRIRSDTLGITGYARGGSECTELRVVAFRSDGRLHVQIEPSDTPLDPCVNSRRFAARFTLPSGPTDLLVTNGFYLPTVLFDGEVRPAEER